jgi:hypothetical protein
MLAADELELAFPGTGAPAFGDEPSLRRILVAVRALGEAAEALAVAARVCRTIGGVLRLVHLRIYDRRVRRAGRFYPETVGDAAAMLDEALLAVWACGSPRATTAVVDAERREVASAITWQVSLCLGRNGTKTTGSTRVRTASGTASPERRRPHVPSA